MEQEYKVVISASAPLVLAKAVDKYRGERGRSEAICELLTIAFDTLGIAVNGKDDNGDKSSNKK